MPPVGTVLDGKYRIDRLVGAGGMGIVAEARHLVLDERVAVKLLLPSLARNEEALARFERETKALVQVKNEHVTRILDVGRLDDGRPFMVMEYLEGQDLAQLLADGHEFSVPESVQLVLQACEAVAEAHAMGIVHRDLKPENLFLTRRDEGSPCLKVLDFGLSKTAWVDARTGSRRRPLTLEGRTLGTPNYISPEQWMSAHNVGPEADQWTLASILYELLAGEPAFDGEQVGIVCTKILQGSHPPLRELRPEVPEGLEAAVHRGLDKLAANRFPGLLELAKAIAPFGPPEASQSVHRITVVRKRAKVDARGFAVGASVVVAPPKPPPARGRTSSPGARLSAPGESPAPPVSGPRVASGRAERIPTPAASAPVPLVMDGPAKASSGRGRWLIFAAALVVGLGGGAVGALLPLGGLSAAPSASPATTSTPEPSEPATPSATVSASGSAAASASASASASATGVATKAPAAPATAARTGTRKPGGSMFSRH